MNDVKPIELGCAGHFICADRCRWRRHTQVGKYRVSTVGDLYINDKREMIGSFGFFETMVFETRPKKEKDNDGCGCREVVKWEEVECARYDTAGDAQAGHERTVAKYLRKQQAGRGRVKTL